MVRALKSVAVIVLGLFATFAASWLIDMPNSSERGAWRLQTGDAVLRLTTFKATLYSESWHRCLQDLAFPAHMKLVELAEGATVNVTDGILHLTVDGALDIATFDRIDALPGNCTQAAPDTATSLTQFGQRWTHTMRSSHSTGWTGTQGAASPLPKHL